MSEKKTQKKDSGPWLRMLLEELHMSVPEICVMLGISVDTYYAYLNNESRPTRNRRDRIRQTVAAKAERLARIAKKL